MSVVPQERVRTLAEFLRSPRLLIFDFDGTIAQTSEFHARAFADVLAPFGVHVHYDSIAGLKTEQALRKCLNSASVELPRDRLQALAAAKQVLARRLITQELQPLAGVDTFLRWASRRHRMAICSSASRLTLELCLQKLGYEGWFTPIVCAEDVIAGKPDPQGFLAVLSLTGVSAQDVVVFEDSQAGIDAAKRAGLKAVSVSTTTVGAPYIPWQAWRREVAEQEEARG